jgi:cytochrome c2
LASLVAVLGFAQGAAADSPPAQALRFAWHGKPVATRGLAELKRLAQPALVRVHEPYEEKPAEFEGLSFAEILDAVYGERWRSAEEILFTCSDGYQPTMPVERVLGHRAWLAFRRADRPDFSIDKFESGARRRVEVGPFYLVWDNLKDAVVRMDGDYGWPYQLVGIDFIRVEDRFPRMVPPSPANAEVERGFTAFRMYCSRCHAMNGDGGRIGQDLNKPLNPIEYRERAWLEKWIDDPTQLNPDTRMPRVSPALKDRARVISDIIAYLAVMPATRAAGAEDGPVGREVEGGH